MVLSKTIQNHGADDCALLPLIKVEYKLFSHEKGN